MPKYVWLVVLVVFLAVALVPVLITQSQPHHERMLQGTHLASLRYMDVSFRNEVQGIDLAGMLFIPDGRGPFPAVVIMHGAGTSSRENIWYLTLTRYLQENGIIVLLPDKRGSEKSGGDWHTSSYEDLATDAVAAVNFMKNQGMVNISQIGIIGMSQGGQISPLVATQSPDVTFLIDVVGTSLSNYDVLHYEETNNLREIGFLPGIADVIAYPSTYVLRKFRQRAFWDAVGNFDALPYWQELTIPALVLYGSADPNVPAEASKARLAALHKENIRVNIYEGSGHALQDPPGAGNRIFRLEALQDIKAFIDEAAPPPPITFTSPSFVFQGDDPSVPIVTHNPSSAMANLYINPGAVLFHADQFHMFFNSFTSWPGVVQVGYMTSDDGVQWRMVQNEPVFTTDQVPFGDGQADVSSVIVMDDGTWVMYFHTIGGGEIGRATAVSPLGPWSVDAAPVLKPDATGWDRNGLAWPSVVEDGRELRMYYGVQTSEGYAIGLATSNDGIHWTKYDDGETAVAPYAHSDPVLMPSAEWEMNRVDRPRVTHSPDGWVMIYQGGPIEKRGLAMSRDGLHWEKYPANPLFDQDAFPIAQAKTWDTNLLYQEGVYYYFMEIGTLSGTDLYLAAHRGVLRK